MAFKNWKKESYGKFRIIYRNKDNSDTVEIVREYNDVYNADTRMAWKVFVNGKKIYNRKTKRLAIRGANVYMRKH